MDDIVKVPAHLCDIVLDAEIVIASTTVSTSRLLTSDEDVDKRKSARPLVPPTLLDICRAESYLGFVLSVLPPKTQQICFFC
ncbi:MAG: hypothetical protein ACLTLQ_08175 [[Clostridium] scindens]